MKKIGIALVLCVAMLLALSATALAGNGDVIRPTSFHWTFQKAR